MHLVLRFIDIMLSIIGILLGFPVMVCISLLAWVGNGNPIFFQERVGRNKQPFVLIKFRTMYHDTASMATHMVSASSITPLGRFLRRTKLDELPQLWNVLKGDMSFVGPRPCLPSQYEVISERDARGVFAIRPGITGLAQVNEVDMSTPTRLAEIDRQMMDNLDILLYFLLIIQTVGGKGGGDRVKVQ